METEVTTDKVTILILFENNTHLVDKYNFRAGMQTHYKLQQSCKASQGNVFNVLQVQQNRSERPLNGTMKIIVRQLL